MQHATKLNLAGVVLTASIASAANAVVIDNFSSVGVTADGGSPWPVTQFELGSVVVQEDSLLGVIGGTRHTTLSLDAVAVLGVDFMQTAIVGGQGLLLDYAASSAADGRLELLYNGGGTLHADFSNELAIQVALSDFDMAFGNPLPVTITLTDGANTASMTQTAVTPGATTLNFALAAFSGIGGVNLTNITGITIGIDGGAAADYRLVGISTIAIPTPGSLALLACASGSALRRRRR